MAPILTSLASIIKQYGITGLSAVSGGPQGLTATGGVISDYIDGSDVYRAHIFTSSGSFDVTDLGADNNVEYFLVGGGGGAGGGNYSGGGGAGGVITNSPSHPLSNGTPFPVGIESYSVVVGGGGGGGASPGLIRNPGNSSIFAGIITAYGGGAGGSGNAPPAPKGGDNGGSGGGGAYANGVSGIGNSTLSSPPQGNNGGEGTPRGGGGGGGAGGIGTFVPDPVGSAPFASNGGIGTSSNMTGISSFYAAGGAGVFFGGTDGFTTRSSGIGGKGATHYNATQTQVSRAELNAIVSTGSGGGGIDRRAVGYQGSGSGSSGIVVARYKVPSLPATAKATGGAISYYGGKTIHVFTSSGNFNVTDGPISAEFFIVAGGGGGGYDDAGGGGGGGVVHHPGLTVGPGPYIVTIGSGGAGSTSSPVKGSDGVDSSIAFPTTYTAYRGGGGGSRSSSPGSTGGSGGGGGRLNGSAGTAAQPATNPGAIEYGNAGGSGSQQGGGGGGAGNAGQDGGGGPPGDGGWGGIGIQAPPTFRDPASAYGGYIPGTPTRAWGFAGGGGGGGNQPAEPPEFPKGGSYNGSQIPGGPYYGGGNGSNISPRLTTSGEVNTGGGGGAGRGSGPSIVGSAGGSGIVLIAYPS